MVSFRDVAEVVKLLGDVVKSTREIIDAVVDGKDYLKTRFPDAQQDMVGLLTQMRLTVLGLVEVTKVISGFRFVYDGTSSDTATAARELARFNDYTIAQKVHVQRLRDNIGELKGKCDKVKELRNKLDTRGGSGWGSMFGLLGDKARQRSAELSGALSEFYADDQMMIEHISKLLKLAEDAIEDVNDSLGPPGVADPYYLPTAAALLGSYATLFKGPKAELDQLATNLEGAEAALAR